jgi:hypothetical protein
MYEYSVYYTLLRSVNIIPNAMKNAAAIRSSVSGPVSVFVISFGGVGFTGVGGVGTTGAGASSL